MDLKRVFLCLECRSWSTHLKIRAWFRYFHPSGTVALSPNSAQLSVDCSSSNLHVFILKSVPWYYLLSVQKWWKLNKEKGAKAISWNKGNLSFHRLPRKWRWQNRIVSISAFFTFHSWMCWKHLKEKVLMWFWLICLSYCYVGFFLLFFSPILLLRAVVFSCYSFEHLDKPEFVAKCFCDICKGKYRLKKSNRKHFTLVNL